MRSPGVIESWLGPGRRDATIAAPAPAENGSRMTEDRRAFEHWYFDARLDSGHVVVVMLQARELIRRRPGIEIHVYEPDGRRHEIARRYPVAAVQAARDRCDVRIGHNRAWAEPGSPAVHRVVAMEGPLGADLRFESTVPAWRPGHGYTQYGERDRFAWLVGAPRARVSGTLRLGDQRLEVCGTGYHDHNWGIGNMPRIVRRWYWGRVYAEDLTLVYANVQVRPRYGSVWSTPLMVAHDDRIVLSTGEVEVEAGPPVYNAVTASAHPSSLRLRAGEDAELHLEVRRVIHAHDLLGDVPVVRAPPLKQLVRGLVGRPGYFRFLSDFELRARVDGNDIVRRGTTLHEMVALS